MRAAASVLVAVAVGVQVMVGSRPAAMDALKAFTQTMAWQPHTQDSAVQSYDRRATTIVAGIGHVCIEAVENNGLREEHLFEMPGIPGAHRAPALPVPEYRPVAAQQLPTQPSTPPVLSHPFILTNTVTPIRSALI